MSTRIVGGSNAPDGRFPYTTALLRRRPGIIVITPPDPPPVNALPYDPYKEEDPHYFCTGTLIAPDVVLSSAWCVRDFRRPRNLEMTFGCTDISNDREKCEVVYSKEVILHPNSDFLINDIGLVILETPVNYPTVALAAPGLIPINGQPVTALGWGVTYDQDRPPAQDLQEVELSVLGVDECVAQLEQFYNFYYSQTNPDYQIYFSNMESKICAFGDGEGVCFSDQGAPFVYRCDTEGVKDVQLGVTSLSLPCGFEGGPSGAERINVQENYDFIVSQLTTRQKINSVTFVDSLDDYCPQKPIVPEDSPTPFPTLDVSVAWTCRLEDFATKNGCHCNCGQPDPDCALFRTPEQTFNCDEGEICVNDICVNFERDNIVSENNSIDIALPIAISMIIIGLVGMIVAFKLQKKNNIVDQDSPATL